MAYDPAKRHHWQISSIVWSDNAEEIAVCELCGTIRRYDLKSPKNQMILGGTCPGTSPEPA